MGIQPSDSIENSTITCVIHNQLPYPGIVAQSASRNLTITIGMVSVKVTHYFQNLKKMR
jgi:hypothetical protein